MEILLSTDRSIPRVEAIVNKKLTFSNRSNFAAAIYNNTLLVVGGIGGSSSPVGTYPTQCEKVNLTTGVVTRVNLGAAYTWCSGVGVGNNLYFCDGHNGAYNNLNRRALIEGTTDFTSLAGVPTLYRHSSLVLHHNGKIYRINGYGSNGATTKSCSVYDIAANTHTAIASPPYSCNGITGCVYNNKIYVFFGWSDDIAKNLNIVQVYDIATNTWTTHEVFEKWRLSWGNGAIVGNYFFYVTINREDSNSYIINRYNLNNLMLPQKEFIVRNTTRRFAGQVLVDTVRNQLLLVGGCKWSPGTANYDNIDKLNSIDCFDLSFLTA